MIFTYYIKKIPRLTRRLLGLTGILHLFTSTVSTKMLKSNCNFNTQQNPANLLSDLYCGRYRRLSSLKSVQFSHFSSLFCGKKSEIHYYRETTIVKKNIYKEKYGCLIYSCGDKALMSRTCQSLSRRFLKITFAESI